MTIKNNFDDVSVKSVYPESRRDLRNKLIVISISIVLLYVFNNLLYFYVPYIPNDPTGIFWRILKNVYGNAEISILTKEFVSCLWAINLFLLVSILGYFSFLLYAPGWYQKFIFTLVSILGILAFFVVYFIFPFKLDSHLLITITKTLIIIFVVFIALNAIRILLKHNQLLAK
jgi:hypothetical protein